MPTLIRNMEHGPTVFSDPPANISIEWQGHGDPTGGDVQHVPDSVVTENVNFLRALQQGIFEVVEASDPEVAEKLQAQVESYRRRREAGANNLESVMDRDSERVIADVAVDEKGRRTVQAPSVVTESDQVDPNTGQPIETSIPVVMGPRERA